jgi:hypothetical protein
MFMCNGFIKDQEGLKVTPGFIKSCDGKGVIPLEILFLGTKNDGSIHFWRL